MDYVFLEETWGLEEIKMKTTLLLSLITWEILIIEDNNPLLFNLTDNLAERNRYE